MHFAVFNLHFGYESFEVFVGYFLQLFQPPEDSVVLFLYCTHFTEYQRQHFMIFSLEDENEDIFTDTTALLTWYRAISSMESCSWLTSALIRDLLH